ncbi:hypothetical protein V6N13_086006 [Hibiscus sabdariffa]
MMNWRSSLKLKLKSMVPMNHQEGIVKLARLHLVVSQFKKPKLKIMGRQSHVHSKDICLDLRSNLRKQEESPTEKFGNDELKNKQNNKPVKHLIKKILKKVHASSGSSNPSPKETTSAATKKKLQKVIKLFHRKVHPESSIADRESKKLHVKKMNNAPCGEDEYTDRDQIQQNKDKLFPGELRSMVGPRDCKTISELPKYELAGCTAATANGEHWIKTDADYLVLEL